MLPQTIAGPKVVEGWRGTSGEFFSIIVSRMYNFYLIYLCYNLKVDNQSRNWLYTTRVTFGFYRTCTGIKPVQR